jgi:putative nucleotidyltransferase with HDIG domain
MTAHEMVARVRNLPPISHAALKLVSLLDHPDAGNEEVVSVLKNDSALTAKLLRGCNSPAVGLAEKVTSVDQAVLILGHNQILQMVTALAFGGAMSVQLPGYAIEAEELWRHSLIAAAGAEIIVKDNEELGEPSVAFTVGMLHDIGKLVMSQFLTEEAQAAVRARVAAGQATADAEREVLGTDHAEVGACLLYLWRLPEEIVEAVANHHQPTIEPKPRLSSVAHVANCLAHLAGASPGWEAYALRGDERVVKLLSIDAEKLDRMIISVRDSFERVNQFMKMS